MATDTVGPDAGILFVDSSGGAPVLRVVDAMGPNAPANPAQGETWLDTGGTAPVLRAFDGTEYVRVSGHPIPGHAPTIITIYELAAALRVSVSPDSLAEPELTIIARLGAVAESLVELHAPNAPEVVKAEAMIRIAGYLYDSPSAGAMQRYANAWANSGAAALLNPWVERRAILPE